jgi:hypothetical protein
MKAARWVQLYHYMLDSEAWRSLQHLDQAIYVELCRRYNGQNNGKIFFSLREGAERFKAGKMTVSRSLERLSDRGFVVPTKKGAFHCKIRHATEWRLTDYDCDGSLATKDFMRWNPAEKKHGTCGDTDGTCGDTVRVLQ